MRLLCIALLAVAAVAAAAGPPASYGTPQPGLKSLKSITTAISSVRSMMRPTNGRSASTRQDVPFSAAKVIAAQMSSDSIVRDQARVATANLYEGLSGFRAGLAKSITTFRNARLRVLHDLESNFEISAVCDLAIANLTSDDVYSCVWRGNAEEVQDFCSNCTTLLKTTIQTVLTDCSDDLATLDAAWHWYPSDDGSDEGDSDSDSDGSNDGDADDDDDAPSFDQYLHDAAYLLHEALTMVDALCLKTGNEYCVTAFDFDDIDFATTVDTDSILKALCSPCIIQVSHLLAASGYANNDIEMLCMQDAFAGKQKFCAVKLWDDIAAAIAASDDGISFGKQLAQFWCDRPCYKALTGSNIASNALSALQETFGRVIFDHNVCRANSNGDICFSSFYDQIDAGMQDDAFNECPPNFMTIWDAGSGPECTPKCRAQLLPVFTSLGCCANEFFQGYDIPDTCFNTHHWLVDSCRLPIGDACVGRFEIGLELEIVNARVEAFGEGKDENRNKLIGDVSRITGLPCNYIWIADQRQTPSATVVSIGIEVDNGPQGESVARTLTNTFTKGLFWIRDTAQCLGLADRIDARKPLAIGSSSSATVSDGALPTVSAECAAAVYDAADQSSSCLEELHNVYRWDASLDERNEAAAGYCNPTMNCANLVKLAVANVYDQCSLAELAVVADSREDLFRSLRTVQRIATLPCIKSGGQFCLAEYLALKDVYYMSLNETVLEQYCTDCVAKFAVAVQNAAVQDGDFDIASDLGLLDLVCLKEGDHWCYLEYETIRDSLWYWLPDDGDDDDDSDSDCDDSDSDGGRDGDGSVDGDSDSDETPLGVARRPQLQHNDQDGSVDGDSDGGDGDDDDDDDDYQFEFFPAEVIETLCGSLCWRKVTSRLRAYYEGNDDAPRELEMLNLPLVCKRDPDTHQLCSTVIANANYTACVDFANYAAEECPAECSAILNGIGGKSGCCLGVLSDVLGGLGYEDVASHVTDGCLDNAAGGGCGTFGLSVTLVFGNIKKTYYDSHTDEVEPLLIKDLAVNILADEEDVTVTSVQRGGQGGIAVTFHVAADSEDQANAFEDHLTSLLTSKRGVFLHLSGLPIEALVDPSAGITATNFSVDTENGQESPAPVSSLAVATAIFAVAVGGVSSILFV